MAQLRNINGDNSTYVNKNMVVSIVSLAAKEVKGVIDVYRSKRLTLTGLFDKNVGKGVKVKYTQSGVTIDIYVVVSTDCEVNDVVYRIQQNVKNSLTSLLPIKIKSINVFIMNAEKISLN